MPVVSAQVYETSIINTLAASDPQMNTALGTPIRKIITAVAQEMAAYNVDVNTTTTLYSLDSVSGTELDYLVGQFGFSRQEARAARGTVTINRDNGDTELTLEYGTYFYKPATATDEAIAFQTTAYQELAEGVLYGEIAIVAVEAGSLGNVPANTITYYQDTSDYVVITNPNPTTGGRDAETDEQLRQRFLLTVFRNVAGTKDQLVGLALAHAQVNKASLIGQESRYAETVQVTMLDEQPDIATASVSDDKWALDVASPLDVERRYWVRVADTQELLSLGEYKVSADGKTIEFKTRQASEVLGPLILGATHNLLHKGLVEYEVVDNTTSTEVDASYYEVDMAAGTLTVSTSAPESLGGNTWTITYRYNFLYEGDFIQVECDYFSKHNRGGLKTVDLYVDGLSPKNVTDIQYIDFDKLVTSENASAWQHEDGTNPTEGHLYIPLSYQPLYSSSGYISVGTTMILTEGVHYKMLYDVTSTKGSSRGMDAVELLGNIVQEGTGANLKTRFQFEDTTVADLPLMDDETPVAIPYLHDYPIEDVQKLIENQRIVTMDALVHEANHRFFVLYLTLMFSTFPKDSVIESVKDNIMAWAEPLPFGYTIQFSDIETIAANTMGVDNVRVSTQGDSAGKMSDLVHERGGGEVAAYGILEVQRDGTTFIQRFTNDFYLAENDIFEVQDIVIYPRTQQRWGA